MTTLTWERHRGHARTYDVLLHGYNYRLDELHAALGRCQLAKLTVNNARRRDLVAAYRRHLGARENWMMPFGHCADQGACHLSVVVAPDMAVRDRAVQRLKAAGIQTSLHYPCVADFSTFRRFATSPLNRSREFASRALTLPLFPMLGFDEVEEICGLLSVESGHEATSESGRHV
jgi:dTDP-4-amino-4,6-dideoxygalactose transaminase